MNKRSFRCTNATNQVHQRLFPPFISIFINQFKHLADFQKASLEYSAVSFRVFGLARRKKPRRLH
ncbi:hypothetical protein B9Z31_09890 [Limnohabitans sp. G3-2]|nr:hypothetical protein B9Z31_09890 [Limnohabitans sp. G3-2]